MLYYEGWIQRLDWKEGEGEGVSNAYFSETTDTLILFFYCNFVFSPSLQGQDITIEMLLYIMLEARC